MAATKCLVLVSVGLFISFGDTLKLPSYAIACSRNDPDISACVLRNGKVGLKKLIDMGGDRKYNIPNLNPLLVSELRIEQPSLNLTLTNVKLNGFKDVELVSAKVDFKAKREEFGLLVPRMEIISDYSVSGRILVLPIHGSGAANFTIPNVMVLLSHDYDLTKGKTGKDHMVTKNQMSHFEKTTGFIELENLFGNKDLSDTMNVVLNENSLEVIGDVGPAVVEAISQVLEKMYSTFTSLVPFDEFYPEKV